MEIFLRIGSAPLSMVKMPTGSNFGDVLSRVNFRDVDVFFRRNGLVPDIEDELKAFDTIEIVCRQRGGARAQSPPTRKSEKRKIVDKEPSINILRERKRSRKSDGSGSSKTPTTAENYLEVLGLYDNTLWPSYDRFDCPLCGTSVASLEGIILKNCLIHAFCRKCLKGHIRSSESLDVPCPSSNPEDPCDGISPGEIEALLTKLQLRKHSRKPTREKLENDPQQLQVFLMDRDLIPNLKAAVCPVCFDDIPVNEGITPKNCLEHSICKPCLQGTIKHSEMLPVYCPGGCNSQLTDREIRVLMSDEEYIALHDKSVKRVLASEGTDVLHCKKVDCEGAWFIEDEGDGRFTCPSCESINCINCDVIHLDDESCKDHHAKLNNGDPAIAKAEDDSRKYIEEQLKSKKVMICPKCKAIVQKVDGCDGLMCSVCRTELCWATRGARWGPKGYGDVSGGCRCKVNGKRCSPKCRDCH